MTREEMIEYLSWHDSYELHREDMDELVDLLKADGELIQSLLDTIEDLQSRGLVQYEIGEPW